MIPESKVTDEMWSEHLKQYGASKPPRRKEKPRNESNMWRALNAALITFLVISGYYAFAYIDDMENDLRETRMRIEALSMRDEIVIDVLEEHERILSQPHDAPR